MRHAQPTAAAFGATRPSVRPLARTADILVSALLLLLTAPVFALLALAVRVGSHGPVLHRERRRRLDGTSVDLHVFRTVVDGGATSHHERLRAIIGGSALTPVGRFLGRTRLVGLPKLIDVLRGDWSMFGARRPVSSTRRAA